MDWTGKVNPVTEAFQQLTPEQKAQAFEVLKAHPDFAKWVKAYHPNPNIYQRHDHRLPR